MIFPRILDGMVPASASTTERPLMAASGPTASAVPMTVGITLRVSRVRYGRGFRQVSAPVAR